MSAPHRLREPANWRFQREALAAITAEVAPARVKRILPTQGVAFICGPSTGGKTALALEVSLRVSRGEAVGGFRSKQCGVVYVAAEDPCGVRSRIAAWKAQHGSDGAFELIGQAPDLRDDADFLALQNALRAAAADMGAENTPLGLVVIDTMSKATPGADQNSSADMGLAMSRLGQLAQQFGVLVVVIAHTGKDQAKGIAGWYGQFAGADAVIMVSGDGGLDAPREFKVEKLKNGPAGARGGFRLRSIVIGEDEDGEAETACILDGFEAPVAVADKTERFRRPKPQEQFLMTAIGYVQDHGPTEPAPQMSGIRPGQQGVRVKDVRDRAYEAGFKLGDEKLDTARKRFERALQTLITWKPPLVRREGDLIWLLERPPDR